MVRILSPEPTWPQPANDDPRVVRGRRLAWLLLLAFGLVTWFGVPHGIGSSWRECDTQAIARNFLLDGFDPLRPRVDWRGDTDGAVECEFPLYQMAIAVVLQTIGNIDAEWPGRLLALLSLLLAGFGMHRLFEWRNGPAQALAGLIAFTGTGSAWMLATRVVPDATSLALSVNCLLLFRRHLERATTFSLLAAALMVTLAGLQKPLALQVGLVMFGWTIVAAPQRLRELRWWLAMLAVPAVVAAWLVHGARLHAETGLSFGVVSGGDTKFPGLSQLVDPSILWSLLQTTATFGVSVVAMAALGVTVWLRRFDRSDAALLVATLLGLLVSLRYSHTRDLGPQYHAFAAFTGAWFVARAWPAKASRGLWLGLLAAVALLAALRARDERGVRIVVNKLPIVEVARAARPHIGPNDRIVVRSVKARRDTAWSRNQNCEDPRFFYLARAHGWVIAKEEFTVDRLAQLHGAGARFVYDPLPTENAPDVAAWLAAHGERIAEKDDGGIVYRLRSRN